MKTALVLEGGGMRGAYTAGCLAWLIENNVHFDSAYGISTGAVHLCSYLSDNIDYLYDLSTNHIADKELIGLRPLLREGHYVGYDYLFEHILPVIKHYDISKAINSKTDAKIGVYDLELGKTVYLNLKEMDDKLLKLKGSCTLPIIGKIVEVEGHKYLDGGITKMIPIEEAVNDQNDLHLIITTKPKDYVRKPAPAFTKALMKMTYPKYPSIAKDYAVRHLNYQKQIDLIKELEEADKAVYVYPSKHVDVKRLTGDKPNLRILYDLGKKDMEAKKELILKRFKKD